MEESKCTYQHKPLCTGKGCLLLYEVPRRSFVNVKLRIRSYTSWVDVLLVGQNPDTNRWHSQTLHHLPGL